MTTTQSMYSVPARRGRRGSPWGAVRRLASSMWRSRKARYGFLILAIFVLMALLAPVISPYSPTTNTFPPMSPPDGAHLLGTTGAGEDVLSQLIYGARDSLIVSLATACLVTIIGMAVGLIAGYISGATDTVLNFVMNILLVIPALPLMIVIAAYQKGGGPLTIILVITLVSWAASGRIVRSRVMSLRALDFVTAARFSGDRTGRIIGRELLPNMISLVAVLFFSTAIGAVLAEAGLEFLGLGSPSTVSWGTMLYWDQTYNMLTQGLWVAVVAPGLCVAFLATAFALINFGIDELSNPRLREN